MSNEALVEFIKVQENAPLAAGDESYLRHPSPEGGLDTIGYGHKLTKAEVAAGKVHGVTLANLDPDAAEHILRVDVLAARSRTNKQLTQTLGIRLDSLSPRKQAMLIDYTFNVGSAVREFPKFTAAVIAGDQAEQVSQMTRSFTDEKGDKHPLARNRAFFNTFMSSEARAQLGE